MKHYKAFAEEIWKAFIKKTQGVDSDMHAF